MNKILYVKASPRKELSSSVTVADAFINHYRELHPEDKIVTIDLFEYDLPAFDGYALQAKYSILHGKKPGDSERKAWEKIEDIIETFKSADKYVFAVPMWNFSIPYRLKQYLDVIIQPGYTFSFSPEEGYNGLVKDKPVFISYARGGEYKTGTEAEAFDMQKKYFKLALGFVGFTDIQSVTVEPTLGAPGIVKSRNEEAILKARELANTF